MVLTRKSANKIIALSIVLVLLSSTFLTALFATPTPFTPALPFSSATLAEMGEIAAIVPTNPSLPVLELLQDNILVHHVNMAQHQNLLEGGHRIETGSSEALHFIFEGANITIAPNSQVELQEIENPNLGSTFDTGLFNFEFLLLEGNIFADVYRPLTPTETFRILTPATVVDVVGTAIHVMHSQALGMSEVNLIKGDITVKCLFSADIVPHSATPAQGGLLIQIFENRHSNIEDYSATDISRLPALLITRLFPEYVGSHDEINQAIEIMLRRAEAQYIQATNHIDEPSQVVPDLSTEDGIQRVASLDISPDLIETFNEVRSILALEPTPWVPGSDHTQGGDLQAPITLPTLLLTPPVIAPSEVISEAIYEVTTQYTIATTEPQEATTTRPQGTTRPATSTETTPTEADTPSHTSPSTQAPTDPVETTAPPPTTTQPPVETTTPPPTTATPTETTTLPPPTIIPPTTQAPTETTEPATEPTTEAPITEPTTEAPTETTTENPVTEPPTETTTEEPATEPSTEPPSICDEFGYDCCGTDCLCEGQCDCEAPYDYIPEYTPSNPSEILSDDDFNFTLIRHIDTLGNFHYELVFENLTGHTIENWEISFNITPRAAIINGVHGASVNRDGSRVTLTRHHVLGAPWEAGQTMSIILHGWRPLTTRFNVANLTIRNLDNLVDDDASRRLPSEDYTIEVFVEYLWFIGHRDTIRFTNTGTEPIENWYLAFQLQSPLDILLLSSVGVVVQLGQNVVIWSVGNTLNPGEYIDIALTFTNPPIINLPRNLINFAVFEGIFLGRIPIFGSSLADMHYTFMGGGNIVMPDVTPELPTEPAPTPDTPPDYNNELKEEEETQYSSPPEDDVEDDDTDGDNEETDEAKEQETDPYDDLEDDDPYDTDDDDLYDDETPIGSDYPQYAQKGREEDEDEF